MTISPVPPTSTTLLLLGCLVTLVVTLRRRRWRWVSRRERRLVQHFSLKRWLELAERQELPVRCRVQRVNISYLQPGLGGQVQLFSTPGRTVELRVQQLGGATTYHLTVRGQQVPVPTLRAQLQELFPQLQAHAPVEAWARYVERLRACLPPTRR